METIFQFVNYGERFDPAPGTLVLDVGMATVPGVIDHHHPEAEAECTASLIAKYPHLVLGHINPDEPLTIVTHKLPDFDSLSSIFLAQKLVEIGSMNPSLHKLAAYARIVDSASLPKHIDLSGTPYAILRALFSGSKKSEEDINRERIEEGLKFMRFLYARADEGLEILENRSLFSGIDRYERAMRKVEADYFRYLEDTGRGLKVRVELPAADRIEKKTVDGLVVANPKSFLLKDWAHRDRDHASLGEGFGFTMISFGGSRYILGVDPERGVNLRGLGAILNRKEAERRTAEGRAFPRPWYEGNCPFFNYRIIDTPQDGTSLSQTEILDALIEFGQGMVL
jgi:hypothetical protein